MLTYANIISSLAGAIDPNLINALPASVTDDSASFHSQIESFGHLKLTVLDAYGKSSFISQLETMGFVSLDSYHLSLKDENYEINVSINDYSGFGCEVNFFCTSFNWTTKPNYYECLDNEMFFWAHEYMPLPDETGNICIIESNNDNELILKFKSSIDMDTYKTKLESFGYEINNKYDDGCDYIYHGSDCDIDCFVDESGDTPRVCFRLLSYDAHPYKGEYLAAVCNNRGFSGITLPEGFVIEANLMEFYENENNKGFNFEKVDNIDQIVSTLQSAGYTETVYEGETVYTKTIGGFTYSVHVYTKDSNVSIEIQSVSE